MNRSFALDLNPRLSGGGPLAVGSVLFEAPLLTRPRQVKMCLPIAATLSPRSGTGLCEAKTGQAKPEWPAPADWPP